MRYSRPLSGDALRSLEARGANAIIGLPLYPQFSRATSGSSLRALRSVLERDFPSWPFRIIESWHGDSGFHRSIARRVASGLEKFGGMQGVGVLFIAHSLPVRFVEEGDPYVRQVDETVEGIRRELTDLGSLKGVPAFLAYQGQVGPVKWVGPAVPAVLQEMVWKEIRRVLVVPVSFVSDHLETLFEIDLQYRRVALELGIEQFERIESLNSGEDFVDVLLGLVLRACMPEERKEGWQG
jgi:ferrochelatase